MVVAEFGGRHAYYCTLVGLAVTGALMWITEYYTGTNYRPVKSIAKSSTTATAPHVIQGLAVRWRRRPCRSW